MTKNTTVPNGGSLEILKYYPSNIVFFQIQPHFSFKNHTSLCTTSKHFLLLYRECIWYPVFGGKMTVGIIIEQDAEYNKSIC